MEKKNRKVVSFNIDEQILEVFDVIAFTKLENKSDIIENLIRDFNIKNKASIHEQILKDKKIK